MACAATASPLSLQSNTFVDALRAGGYATALVGKSHLQNFSEFPAILKRPPPRAGDQVLDAEFAEARKPVPATDLTTRSIPERWEAGRDFEMKLPFYGFEHVDLCTTHGDQVGGHYYVWLKARRPDADALRDRKNQLPHDYVCPQAYRTPIPEELYPTAYIAEKSCEWLDRYAAGDRSRPFFMMTSFPRPASPVHAAGQILVDVPASGHGAAAELRSRQPPARALGRLGAGAARERQGHTHRAGGFRGRRTRGARGDGAELRHDHHDRRRHRSRAGALAARGLADDTVVDLHQRSRRLSRRPSADAQGPGAFRGDHPCALHLGRARRRPARTADVLAGTLDIAIDHSRSCPDPAVQRHPGDSLLPAIGGDGSHPRTRW